MPSLLAPIESTPYIGGNVPGDLSVTASGLQHVRKHNLAATTAPGVGDDTADGYEVGSLWTDTTADKAYLCLDATEGAAVWTELTAVTLPAGTGTEIQYRSSATAFGAVTGSSWDGSTLTLTSAGGAPTTFVIKSNATASGYLQTWVSASGGVLSGVDASGRHIIPSTGQSALAGALYFAGRLTDGLFQPYTGSVGVTANGLGICIFDYTGTVFFGNGVTAVSPASCTLKGTGGSGTNVVGGNLIIAPGPSTGSATPSDGVLKGTVPSTSGATSQTLVDVLRWGNGRLLVASNYQLQFRDTGLYLFSQADGYLNVVADTGVRIGDATPTNYTQFDSTGHQTMVGTAKPWEDLRIEPSARTTGANAPTFEKWLDDVAGSSRGVYLYSFDDAAGGSEKEVFFSMQMPHAWDGGPIEIHVHWIGDVDDTTADPRWGLEYAWKDIGEVFGDTTTVYSDGTHIATAGADANVTAKKHYITKMGTFTPGATADGLSSIFIGRLFRDSANAADTYNAAGAKCGLLYIDAHYQINSLGSTDEYTK